MADKKIIIDGKQMMYGTSVKASPEISSNSTATFDGAIVDGLDNVSWTIELERVRYDDKATHMELSQKLDSMMSVPAMVTVREIIRPPNDEAPYEIVDNFHNCIIDGNDYEIKPEDRTVENVKFKASKRKRKWLNVKK